MLIVIASGDGHNRLHLLSSLFDADMAKERVEVVLSNLARRPMWLPTVVGLSMAALLVAGCGRDEAGTDAPAVSQASTPVVADSVAKTEAPAATAVPTTAAAEAAVEVGYKVGQRAPDFTLTTVEGEEVSLEGFQGQPLLIYFYATW